MKSITVAELQADLSVVLQEVEAGATYVVNQDWRSVARLVPVSDREVNSSSAPAKHAGPSALAGRPRAVLHTYEETQALLAALASPQ